MCKCIALVPNSKDISISGNHIIKSGEMVDRLGYTDSFTRNYISAFELGTREPPLPVLLAYARFAKISTDVLIDDELDLFEKDK
jgi:transcriptional regulator with XRE-family HTH domain